MDAHIEEYLGNASTLRDEVSREKSQRLSEAPGLVVEFDPREAEDAGAFQEDALSEEDARDAVYDEEPLGV